MKQNKPKAQKLLHLLWILPLLLVLTVFLLMYVVPAFETADKTAVADSADWMAKLSDDRSLGEVVLPGTHDSATKNVQLAFFSKCQSLDIRGQLDAGYRYLDIRLGLDEESGELILKHGFTNCKPSALSNRALTLSALIADCCAFLDAHPGEVILFCVKHEHGDFSIAEMQTLLDGEIGKRPDRWFLSDSLPTVGEARGRIVLLRRYGDDAGLGERAGVPFAWNDQGGADNPTEDVEANIPGDLLLWVQDRYEYDTDDKWNAFLAGLAIGVDDGEAAVHFLSTKGSLAYGHPYWFARTLNRRLLAYDLPAGEPLGWIIVDFGSPRLADHIWQCNFDGQRIKD